MIHYTVKVTSKQSAQLLHAGWQSNTVWLSLGHKLQCVTESCDRKWLLLTSWENISFSRWLKLASKSTLFFQSFTNHCTTPLIIDFDLWKSTTYILSSRSFQNVAENSATWPSAYQNELSYLKTSIDWVFPQFFFRQRKKVEREKKLRQLQ